MLLCFFFITYHWRSQVAVDPFQHQSSRSLLKGRSRLLSFRI
jgi:hypothetical protein